MLMICLRLFALIYFLMSQTVHSDLFFNADHSGLTFQHRDVDTIEQQLINDCTNLRDGL